MSEAAFFARRLFPDNNIEGGEYPAQILATIAQLDYSGIHDWGDLLSRIATRDNCMGFVTENNLRFEEFIDVLNYLLRWAFPFQTASRELFEQEDSQEMSCYDVCKQHKLMNSFEILELGRTMKGRRSLARQTGLPQEIVTSLAHRADIVRLPYVRRKTLLPLCGAGYDTLARIAAADLAQMKIDLDTYFRHTRGKSWEDYKAVIVVKLIVTAAQALPVIIED